MLIECIGLPGSGKTTYLNNNKTFVVRETIDESEISIIKEFIFYLKNWKLVSLFWLGVFYNFDIRIKKWYALVIGVNKTLKQYAKINYLFKEKEIILDEGLLQRALSVYCFKKRTFNLVLLKKTIIKIKKHTTIDVVYVFEVSVDESIKRSLNRPDGLPFRFKKLSNDKLIISLTNFQKGIFIILKTNIWKIKVI